MGSMQWRNLHCLATVSVLLTSTSSDSVSAPYPNISMSTASKGSMDTVSAPYPSISISTAGEGSIDAVPLLILLPSLTAGIVLLILLVLLAVCLVHRRKQQAKHPGPFIQTQLPVIVRNSYEHEEDSDEENDYVNVDPADTKKAGTEEETDSKDYEEPESDEDHDYEEADSDANFMNAQDAFFSSEIIREEVRVDKEEEEEESSDDDNDYENVTQSVIEQNVDIYGHSDNIYQNF